MTKNQTWCVIALFAVLVGAYLWSIQLDARQKEADRFSRAFNSALR